MGGSRTGRGWRWAQVLVLCCALLVPAFGASTAKAALPITVTTTIDSVDAAPGNGTCADAGGNCSLRAAIMEANALPGPDTIIVPPGVYTLTIPGRDENASATGDLDITDAVVITGSGGNRDGDPAATIVQAGPAPGTGIDKVFSVNPNFDKAFATTLEALTIRYGNNTSSRSGDGYGGGLDWEASGTGTLSIYNSVLTENTAADGDGGGLMVSNGPNTSTALVTITKSQFTHNQTANGVGAGIFVGYATPFTIIDSVISHNTAFPGSSSTGAGAGLFSFGTVAGSPQSSITGSLISNNVSNGSGSDGGGIYSTSPLVISNTTIMNNQTGRNGGGLYMSLGAGAAPSLTNVTISGNTAGGAGGGYAQDGLTTGAPIPATVTNVTVTGNRATTGGGVWRDSSIVTMTMHNSIVGGNFQGTSSSPDDVSGTLEAASSHNLIGPGGSGGLTNGTNGNQVGVADLRLAPLANNGGLTPTHALLHGSPALDAGNNAVAPGTDQRGGPRVADSADPDATALVDIGAFEAHPAVEDIGNQSTAAGTPVTVTFHVGDNSLGISSITASSTNPVLLPAGSMSVGAGPSPTTRTLTITPAGGQSGAAVITVTAFGGVGSMSGTFELTVTAPPPPVEFVTIDPLAAETREASLLVTGQANPSATVQVNGSPALADAAGAWSITVPLVEGTNTISAVNGPASASATVVRDSTPPLLTLTASETVTEAASVTLTAASEPGASVAIQGQATTTLTVPLVLGLNTFSATATDHLGNQATASVTVERVAPAPPPEPVRFVTIDWLPAETREASILVTGRANAFYTVQVNGTPTQANAAGVWSLTVSLAEGPNMITAVNGAASASVAVLRDSTPPVLTLTAAETRTEAESVVLTATSEPGASVAIQGQATTTLTVPLVLGLNTFSATATDRLGNQSTASVTVERVAPPPPPETQPSLNALPAEVEQPGLVVTGTAMAGTTVTLLLNDTPQGTTAVDADGAFSMSVTLVEGANRLVARSASGLTSGEAVVVYRRPIHFSDVAGHWAEAAIYRMARRGVVQGFPDETFRPEDQVTRLEYAVMLSRTLGLTPSTDFLPFSDADQVPEWARPHLAAAVQAGIVEGHDDGRFASNDLVTRAEAAVMLVRAFRYASGVAATGHVTFIDQDAIPVWAAEAVSAAAAHHLVVGYADGTFRPAGSATRAEAVTMLDRLMDLLAR